jgi:hypothetical protein
MPLLKAEAEKLSNNMLERGVIEEIIERDATLALLPFMRVDGKAYVYNRETTLGQVDFLDPNDAVNEGAATFTEVTTKLRILAGDVDVDKFLASTMNDTNDQVAVQLAAKAKQIRRKFQAAFANGDNGVNAKEFDGIRTLTPNSQTLTAGTNGASLTLDMLDELKDAVPNGPDAYIMRPGTIRAWKALVRASGGTMPEHQMLSNFVGTSVPMHDGIPILINDFLPGDETVGSNSETCSVYAARMNEIDGLHGIWGGQNGGVAFEEIGTVQNKDAFRYRMKWYVGLALKSTKSIARLKGITNI